MSTEPSAKDDHRPFDRLHTGVCSTDRSGVITYANEAFAEMLGAASDALRGQEIAALFEEEADREALKTALDALARGERLPHPLRTTCRRQDGRDVTLELDLTFDTRGFLAFVSDVAVPQDEHASQRAIGLTILLEACVSLAATLELERVLQVAVDGVTGLSGLDTAAVYLLAGDTLRLGATTPPLPPDFPEALRVAPLEDHPHIKTSLMSRESLLVPDYRQVRLTAAERAVAERRDLRTVLYLPIVAEGEVLGVFIVGSVGQPTKVSEAAIELSTALASLAALAVRNAQLFEQSRDYAEQLEKMLDEREKAEQERVQLQTQLAHAQRVESIGRLAGGVAHDLNNLLSPILGYSDLLLEDLGPHDERREMVELVVRAGMRAKELIGQLLAFGRKQTLAYASTSLDATVQSISKLLRRTIPENIVIDFDACGRGKNVMADAGQIERVIINLAINAADAMPKGGRLAIRTALVSVEEDRAALLRIEPGEHVMLRVGHRHGDG